MLELESLVCNMSERIVEDDLVVKLFADLAKHHVDKALDDWRKTTNLAKAVAELSERVKDVAKASKKEPRVHEETSGLRRSRYISQLGNSHHKESRHPQSDRKLRH